MYKRQGDNYTRYKVTVTNGGVLRVGEYAYDGAGLGSMAVNTGYWTLNNGRLEITKESDGTFGNGLTVAAGGGAVEVVNAEMCIRDSPVAVGGMAHL